MSPHALKKHYLSNRTTRNDYKQGAGQITFEATTKCIAVKKCRLRDFIHAQPTLAYIAFLCF